MDESWPEPTEEVAETIRGLCQRLLADSETLTDEVSTQALAGRQDPALLSDASLRGEDRALSQSDLVHWLTSNVQRPGVRVEPYVGPRAHAYIRDLVSRGIAPDFAGGWRAALVVAWRRWLEECAAGCDSTELLVEVLDVSGRSLVQYALDSVAALREASLAAAMGDADERTLAVIQLIAGGTPMAEDFAESRLGYRLARHHVALVVWVDDPVQAALADDVTTRLRADLAGRTTLVARASETSRWLWLSGDEPPEVHHVEEVVASAEGVRVSLGRPGRGLSGFRSSHQDALAGQALVVRMRSARRFLDYGEVELVDALTRDRDSARRFVSRTLGPLAEADEVLREALLTYVQSGFSTTRAAASLYAHRNTVERRVSRANELCAVPVEENPAHVAAALLVLQLVPDIVDEEPA